MTRASSRVSRTTPRHMAMLLRASMLLLEIDKKLVALDMKSEVVREAATKVTDDTLDDLYDRHAGDYG